MTEYLLIDKLGDYIYFKKLDDISTYLNLTKSQTYNICRQSLKHYNKYTNRGYYIQRLYNDISRTPKMMYNMDKYIYYEIDGELSYGHKFKCFD